MTWIQTVALRPPGKLRVLRVVELPHGFVEHVGEQASAMPETVCR